MRSTSVPGNGRASWGDGRWCCARARRAACWAASPAHARRVRASCSTISASNPVRRAQRAAGIHCACATVACGRGTARARACKPQPRTRVRAPPRRSRPAPFPHAAVPARHVQRRRRGARQRGCRARCCGQGWWRGGRSLSCGAAQRLLHPGERRCWCVLRLQRWRRQWQAGRGCRARHAAGGCPEDWRPCGQRGAPRALLHSLCRPVTHQACGRRKRRGEQGGGGGGRGRRASRAALHLLRGASKGYRCAGARARAAARLHRCRRCG
jgi:hypothetical protein